MVYAAKLRNQIMYGSTLRGYLSGLAFVLRLYKAHKHYYKTLSPGYLVDCISLYVKGVMFKPKIIKPD